MKKKSCGKCINKIEIDKISRCKVYWKFVFKNKEDQCRMYKET